MTLVEALCDYYDRCKDIVDYDKRLIDIPVLINISDDGKFLFFERMLDNNGISSKFLVAKCKDISNNISPSHLYGDSKYLLGFGKTDQSDKAKQRISLCMESFKKYVSDLCENNPDIESLKSVNEFYQRYSSEDIIGFIESDEHYDQLKKLFYSNSKISFRIKGDKEIVASKKDILSLYKNDDGEGLKDYCLATGELCVPVETVSNDSSLTGRAKFISFQKNSGYDSFGHIQCGNAPLSATASFKISAAIERLASRDSRNNIQIGDSDGRRFIFWSTGETTDTEDLLRSIICPTPDDNIENVRAMWKSVFSGNMEFSTEGEFYIVGFYVSTKGRCSVVHLSNIRLNDMVDVLKKHYNDMSIDLGYSFNCGFFSMLKAVAPNGVIYGNKCKLSPSLPEQLMNSILTGCQYPHLLFQNCLTNILRDVHDKNKKYPVTSVRAGIIKAYINRLYKSEIIKKMLDKENVNIGYLCGRLFAVQERVQEVSNKDKDYRSNIRIRFGQNVMTTPAVVFPAIENENTYHYQRIDNNVKTFFDLLKEEITSKIDKIPMNFNQIERGQFWIGYYHQRNSFFEELNNKKNESNN